ncbi:hypothetical protein [Paenibacillus tengchongensis]|uniref:hypothetical protein n=1 Tax=Paenibacillus tengchongensis TaxID=2608684 RepID=UPI00124F3591|nr:hypothetical protein [Paenibacillus tengchongensis]
MFKSDELFFKYEDEDEDAEVEIWGLEIAHFNNIDDLQNEVISGLFGENVIPNTAKIRISNSYFKKAWEQMPVSGPGALREKLIAPSYLFTILSDPLSAAEVSS